MKAVPTLFPVNSWLAWLLLLRFVILRQRIDATREGLLLLVWPWASVSSLAKQGLDLSDSSIRRVPSLCGWYSHPLGHFIYSVFIWSLLCARYQRSSSINLFKHLRKVPLKDQTASVGEATVIQFLLNSSDEWCCLQLVTCEAFETWSRVNFILSTLKLKLFCPGSLVGWCVVPACQSCEFDPQSRRVQESTSGFIDKWNNKLVFLPPSLSSPLSL